MAGVVLNDIGPVIEGTGLARIKKYLTARRTLRDWDEAVSALRQVMGSHFPAIGDEDWRAYAEGSFIATPRGLLPSFDLNLVKTLEHVDFSRRYLRCGLSSRASHRFPCSAYVASSPTF